MAFFAFNGTNITGQLIGVSYPGDATEIFPRIGTVPTPPASFTCPGACVWGLLPRALAFDSSSSRSEGNDTLLILDRIGGNLTGNASEIGKVFGILYDQLENPYSWVISGGCQIRRSIGPGPFPRTTPRFENVITPGSVGWMKMWALGSPSDPEPALFGAAINYNPNTGSNPTAFNQGHNLHILTKTATGTYTIPVFPPRCN